MKSLPPLSQEPPKEAWAPAEPGEAGEGAAAAAAAASTSTALAAATATSGKQAWFKKKVFSDIIKHTSKDFPPEHRDQWRALQSFHDKYPTSDA
eukprot:3155362-Pleurochrysis_carterae.AAC.1